MLKQILDSVIYVRAIAFGDIIPDKVEALIRSIGITASDTVDWRYP